MLAFAGLLAAAGTAPGCDDISAQSFGGNAAITFGSGGAQSNGGLVRGHGGAIAIGIAAGTGGVPASAAGGAGGAHPSNPVGGGGAAGGSSAAPSVPVTSTGGAIGTGGAVAASGGATVATGGASATGGTTTTSTATGGVTGTGGGAATGGHVGSGGTTPVAASGGAAGMSGPSAGGGGTTTPGVAGSGGKMMPGQSGGAGGAGDPGPGGDNCTKLSSDYDAALTKAKSCDAKGKGPACGKAVPEKLTGCGASCDTYVDDDGQLTMIRQKWTQAGCVPESCAASLCIAPTGGTCDKGTCSDTLLGL